MSEQKNRQGGCCCGAIRYQAVGTPAMVAYCHCEDCRRSGGSVVAVLAGFPREQFELIAGKPTGFSATPGVTRSFCSACGTPLLYENDGFAENIYLHVGTLDNPDDLPPDRHTWVSDRVSWHRIDDDLFHFDRLSNAGRAHNTPAYAPPDSE